MSSNEQTLFTTDEMAELRTAVFEYRRMIQAETWDMPEMNQHRDRQAERLTDLLTKLYGLYSEDE